MSQYEINVVIIITSFGVSWPLLVASSSGVPVQQSGGSSPSHDTCVLKQDTYSLCFVLRIRRKVVGPLCEVAHIKEPSTF